MATIVTTDIDIDFFDRDTALAGLDHVCASMDKDGQRQRHPSGVYFQDIPLDPLTGLSAFDYKEAEERGYFKIDFLNNTSYEGIRDESHLIDLMAEPSWELLEFFEIVVRMPHIREHFGLVQQIRPKSVEDLALIIALIRPGKQHLMAKPRHIIEQEIWQPDPAGFVFKKSHAIAYAMSIVVRLNLETERQIAAMQEAEENAAD